MHHLPYLDININYACNLSCEGCISLSNFDRKGYVNVETGEDWLKAWAKKLTVDTICLFGGEPLMNPDILKWISLTRQYFPDAHLKVITNGYYLKSQHIDELSNAGNATLQISYHIKNDDTLIEIIKSATSHRTWKLTAYDNKVIFLKFANEDMFIQCANFGEFRKPYKGTKKDMEPWESTDLLASIDHCGSPKNPILYNNRVYKCAPIANLQDALPSGYSIKWNPYLEYKGFGSEDDLQPLVDDFGKPNKICSMCCSTTESEIDHYGPGMVRTKKK